MQPAKPIIVESMNRLNPKSVLDLGCGSCKFSQNFINRGIIVTGVDKNPTISSQDNFTFVQQNILDFKFEPKYDLILGSVILHFLEKEDAHKLIEKMKKNTLPKGFNFLICMSNEERPNNESYFYPNQEMLTKLYSGWEIINNTLCLSKKHGKTMHQHKLIILLTRKI